MYVESLLEFFSVPSINRTFSSFASYVNLMSFSCECFTELLNRNAASDVEAAQNHRRRLGRINFLSPFSFLSWKEFGFVHIFIAAVCCCFFFCIHGEARVIGIDMGDEFIKVALVSPGKPFEIVLNSHSKRKSMTAVSFAETGRAFGDATASLVSKSPSKTFLFTNSLLGYNSTNIVSNDKREIKEANGLPHVFYPYEYVINEERGSVNIQVNDQLTMNPEELAANLLGFVKNMALNSENEDISARGGAVKLGGVATVPCSFTQRQRQALIDAAELAGIEMMGMVHGPAAAAVHQSLDLNLTNSTSHINLIYDIGSRSIDVAIIKTSLVSITGFGKQKEAHHVQMLSCASVNNAGGHFLDIALAEKAAEEFKKKHNIDVRQHPRAMKKLLNQAVKTKFVLSANNKSSFIVENLHDDKDFRGQINREELDEMIVRLGMLDKLKAPVITAMERANVTFADLQSIELVGGGWRVPRIQQELSNIFYPLPLGQHLNGDEAMAMGAAFIAANCSAAFRVRKVFLTDTSVFSYNVHLLGIGAEKNADDEEPIDKLKELIGVGSRLYGTKTMVLKSKQDLNVSLFENNNFVSQYEIRGVAVAAREQYKDLQAPKVSLVFKVSNSGIIKLERAYATFEDTVFVSDDNAPSPDGTNITNNSTFPDGTNSTFPDGTNSTFPDGTNSTFPDGTNSTFPDGTNSTFPDGTNSTFPGGTNSTFPDGTISTSPFSADNLGNTNDTDAAAEIKKTNETSTIDGNLLKKKNKKYTVNLGVQEFLAKPFPLTSEQKIEGKKKLNKLDEIDSMVVKTANARNSLETYIYACRDNVEKEASQAVSSEEQRQELLNLLSVDEEWLYGDDGWNANADILESKIKYIELKMEPILKRAIEYEGRSKLTNQMNSTIRDSYKKLDDYKRLRTWIPTEIMEGAQNATRNIEQWWIQSLEKQNSLPNTSDPAFTKASVKNKMKELHGIIKAIEKIPKPKPPPPPPTSPPSSTETSSPTTTAETSSSANQKEGDTSSSTIGPESTSKQDNASNMHIDPSNSPHGTVEAVAESSSSSIDNNATASEDNIKLDHSDGAAIPTSNSSRSEEL